ncbi:Tsl-kinase interacting protein [Thalictrum thalictroides]|uniref:Tsl-kinase interacting protein n=1 Tax=Thalictrum thalictroides TaxID=46969 RepID=A0A7J6UZM6_THATH|nr:Tsl-kinase interacting protein [Thalictrum thalictroides]
MSGCEGEAPFPSADRLNTDAESAVTSSSPSIADSHQPAKKQTRQWAAWTRQEEESFFNALRQVGKNFDMITCRVQSKNKDQVRHYYYRLVRRMNKLLGPGFSLDAKNSKDTNAAMLRWWSLLEKYSCKASKLHLKPRRFKIFIEALEHQLLKDRKKTTRKRPSQNENSSSSSAPTLSLQNKASGHDTRSVKLVLVDSQNIQKVASGKGSLMKRSFNNGTNRSNNKGDLSTVKTTRQRRKTGGASSAAYKRWEKAAIAGVSLVADAAEHLERTTINKNAFPDQGITDELFSSTIIPPKATDGQMVIDSFRNNPPHVSVPASSQHQVAETSGQVCMKLKLQLFPIDEATRTALEKGEHNPHLELTLSARKKITSVLEHLNRKWGKSSIASGQLILFPYSAQRDSLACHQRWTQDTLASAADVYASIGSPHVFRLRYGWFSSVEVASVTSGSSSVPLYPQDESTSLNICTSKEQSEEPPTAPMPDRHSTDDSKLLMGPYRNQPTSVTKGTDLVPSSTDFPEDMIGNVGGRHEKIRPREDVPKSPWLRKQTGEGISRRQWEDVDNLRMSTGASLSAGDWADSLTNISIGELLTEASRMETNGNEPPLVGSPQLLLQIPFSCDSFDAAIAAHIAGRQKNLDPPAVPVSHVSSIWDAEETCDAFSFRKMPSPKENSGPSLPSDAALETCRPISTASVCFKDFVEELTETRTTENRVSERLSSNTCESYANEPSASKDFGGLTDIYWPDSLGPLDLEVPSSRCQGHDLIFGDSISLSGLNRLIANSVDAFQNCSFFGLDKASTMSESHETAPLLEHKIGGEV